MCLHGLYWYDILIQIFDDEKSQIKKITYVFENDSKSQLLNSMFTCAKSVNLPSAFKYVNFSRAHFCLLHMQSMQAHMFTDIHSPCNSSLKIVFAWTLRCQILESEIACNAQMRGACTLWCISSMLLLPQNYSLFSGLPWKTSIINILHVRVTSYKQCNPRYLALILRFLCFNKCYVCN